MSRFKSSLEAGIGGIEVLLIVIVIGLAGTLGWVAYTKFATKDSNTGTVQTASGVADLEKKVEINTSEDIDKASQDIDSLDINDDGTLSEAESAVDSL